MKKNRRKILSGSRKILFAILAMFLSLSASAQQITASGQVLDAQNEPLIGVSVQEKGTTNGAITDLDGNFSLNVQQNAILVFSYVGYKSQEMKAARQMKVTLQEDNEVLDEVVVIGYGSVKRKDVTTAISSVSTKDLDMRPIVSAGQAIQGKAAGVSVIQPNGTPGGEMSIRVRGTTSMNGSNDPLYVVDGVPVDNIKFLSPNDIESMQILKDASSASIYGSRAANGVILITTKAGATGNAKVSLTAQFGLNKVADKVESLNAANKISWDNTGTGASQWGIMSFFGRVAYNFDSKYLLTANIRADGSSKLHPDHRWGVFPSFSAAWRISSEKFMEDLTWIDDLKLRGGWGQTGNQSGIGDYAYLQRYNIGRIEWFKKGEEGDKTDYANAVPTISQANLRTSDLTWETTTQTNIGLDLTVLNGRLTFNADYYYKKTKNMLMNVSLPAGAAAATSIARNEGEMVNKGFELSISSKNFRGGAFTWDTDFNISFNRNKLTKLELQKVYYDAKTADVVNDYVVRNEPGRALGGFYGYISDGVDPETGELMYRDLNHDGKISSSDRTYIGDPNPDFTYGMTNTFSWKGFNLSIFIQGSYGNDIYNASRIETEGMYDGKNQSTRVLGRWKIPGQITDVPKANFKLLNSTYFVEDGSYLRLKDVSLSYNVKGKLLKKWGITRLQPYFTATNLLTWTSYSGMDPEVNQWGNSGTVQGIDWGTYPHCRSYVFGINVEF